MSLHTRSALMVVAACCLFAFWGVIARAFTLPLPLLLMVICIGGGALSALFVRKPFRLRRNPTIVGLIIVADLLFMFLAFQRISLATTIALHFVGPILIAFLAPFVLKEQFSPRNVALAMIGFVAVAVLCKVEFTLGAGSTTTVWGLVFALASAVTLAGNIMFQRASMIEQQSAGNAVTQYNIVMTLGYAALVPLWPLIGGGAIWPLPEGAGSMLIAAFFIGVLIQGVAMMLYSLAVRHLDSQTTSCLAFSEVAFTILLGAVIYHEAVTPLQLAAVAVIMLVAYAAQRGARKTTM